MLTLQITAYFHAVFSFFLNQGHLKRLSYTIAIFLNVVFSLTENILIKELVKKVKVEHYSSLHSVPRQEADKEPVDETQRGGVAHTEFTD